MSDDVITSRTAALATIHAVHCTMVNDMQTGLSRNSTRAAVQMFWSRMQWTRDEHLEEIQVEGRRYWVHQHVSQRRLLMTEYLLSTPQELEELSRLVRARMPGLVASWGA